MNKAKVLKSAAAARSSADWGDLTWFASSALGNSTEMTVGRCLIVPGGANPLHRHPNCSEILVVISGKISHTIDESGGEVEMTAGDTITIPRGLLHRARNTGDVDAVLMLAYSSADRQVQGESVRIGFDGRLVDQPRIRAGFIGCGSHAFRNIYPTFPLVPVQLVATCDLDGERAAAFARQFGAERSYDDHRSMLEKERLDAVFIVTGYDAQGRPQYPALASDCLAAGCHVWMEKPPAASCREIERLRATAGRAGRQVMVGLKKMFFPANRKARELMLRPDFGQVGPVTLQYPQSIPTMEELAEYSGGRKNGVTSFLDHLCHPASLLVYLLGMPTSLIYERSVTGAGAAVFTFRSGAVATLAFSHGSATDGGMERTVIVGQSGRHIIVDNNTRVEWRHSPANLAYGAAPDYFQGDPEAASAVWQPEFSLGQLYNKGLVLLGYYDEVNEFARAVLEGRKPDRGTLEQAWQVTRIFEAFAEGPGRRINLPATP